MPRLIAIEGHESQRRKLEELLSSLFAKGYALNGKFEASTLGGWPAIFAFCSSRGLFDEKRILVVEGAEQLGLFPLPFGAFLENEDAEDIIVSIFTSDSKKIFPKEILDKITLVRPDEAIPPWKRKEWLSSLAHKHNCKLDNAAIILLTESIESQEELRAELGKLALYAEGRVVTIEDVKMLSFDEGGNALLRFLDGVCNANIKDVLNSLKYLRTDASPLLLLTALYNRLRPALYIAMTSPEMQNRSLLAIGATREYALRMAKNALSHFGNDAVKRFMLNLIRLSYLEKTSFAEGWVGFELALWQLMGKT